MKQYYVYCITNWNNKTLYTGVTNDLERRLYEHKHKLIPGFTSKYNLNKLVHFETFLDIRDAIEREKYLKGKTRTQKNSVIEKKNPDWIDLSKSWYEDPSASPQDDNFVNCHPERPSLCHPERSEGSNLSLERYTRQLALPEISVHDQTRLANTHIAVIGAGGLGAAALPYLAAAGIGHITIYDHDTVSRSNLHRQTLYKDAQEGQNKAELAAAYIRDLNPDIEVTAHTYKFCHPERSEGSKAHRKDSSASPQNDTWDYDLIIDGSDNFETKTLLNKVSIENEIPLISASVNQWAGQIGIFAGFAKDRPCYHCLFPNLPTDARNCNEAGILGTSAGITGLYQAHATLCYLLGLEGFEPGRILSFDFKTLRMQTLNVGKNPTCEHCKNAKGVWKQTKKKNNIAEMISFKDLQAKDHIIVDVRTDMEIANDPIPEEVIHMEVSTLPARYEELPKDKLLAFVCAGNVRSVQAAQYLEGLGYTNICVLDKFSI